MAEIDSSIYFQRQNPDILGQVQRGLSMGDAIRNRNKQKAEDEAIKAGIVTNPDGSTSVDENKTLSELAKVGGAEYFEGKEKFANLKKQQAEAQRAQQMQHIDVISRIAPTINDQLSYQQGLQQAAKFGVDISDMPKSYDKGLVDRYAGMALSAKERMDEQFRRDDLASKSADRRETRNDRNFQKDIIRQEKRDRQVEQDVHALSKDVAGTQELMGALDEVEQKLGSGIEAFKKDGSGNLTRDGKKVDLPGVSLPLIGRVSAYSNSARELQSAASRVFNATLKDRSGGAVTDNELDRLRTEFNEGKYNTESELVDALQRYKRQTIAVLKNREAGFSPEVIDKYTYQGGRTSQTVPGSGGSRVAGGEQKTFKTKDIDWAD